MTTKDNLGTLPINLYAMGPSDGQPLDLTKLGDQHSLQQMPQKEVTEFLCTFNQIVCVKHDKGGPENTWALACLQENVKVGIKKVMAKIFVQDRFNPICFSEIIKMEVEELTLLQDEIQQTSDVLTLTEVTEISADEPEVMRHSSRRRKRRFGEDYIYYMTNEVK